MLIIALAFLALSIGAYAVARVRRDREADRWALSAGTQRYPNESTAELVERIAARYRISYGGGS